MTVLEFDSATRPTLAPPFDNDRPPRQQMAGPFALLCPNIDDLPLALFQKAAHHLQDMAEALQTGQPETFNEAKRQLIQVLKKHGEPVSQVNPLVLELADPTFLKGANLPHVDFNMTRLRAVVGRVSLEGACLQSAGFLCADLNDAILTEADLTGADLRFADLSNADLSRALLIEAKLNDAKLIDARLNKANLYCASLVGACLKHAMLEDTNLRKADLRNADGYRANLRYARMQHADLREANLLLAELTGAKLRHADLRKAYLGFCCLREARFPNARLQNVDFSGSDLTLADFQKCRLISVTFNRAVFAGTTLKGVEMHEVDFSECCDLATASLEGARFDETTRFPQGFLPGTHEMQNLPFGMLRRIVQRIAGVAAKKESDKRLMPGH